MNQTEPEIGDEYIVVSDTSSIVLLSTNDCGGAKKLAYACRESGGSVTIFKSTED